MEETTNIQKWEDRHPEAKTISTQAGSSPASMMQAALNSGVDIEKLEHLLELQQKWEANEARKAYHEAMALFKANPPKIEKDRKVSYKAGGGMTEYSHASLANVCEKINSGLGEYGLSAAWKTEQAEKGITVTCTVTHKLGHSESTSLFAAPDTSGSKNSIQAIGSTISYLERYTILALTGLATGDMDDDGASSSRPVEYITEKQVSELTDMINDTKTDETKFLAYIGTSLKCEVDSIQNIPVKGYQIALAALKAKMKKIREPGSDDDK